MPERAVAALCILTPLITFYMGQYIYLDAFSFYSLGVMIVNWLLLNAIFCFIVFLSNRRLAIILTHIVVFLWSCANYFVVYFRGNPVLPWDFTALDTAADVFASYRYLPTLSMIVSFGYILCLSIFVIYTFPKQTFAFKKTLPSRIVALCISALSALIIFFPSRIEAFGAKTDVWDQAKAYGEGGSLAVFCANLKFLKVEVPEDYSDQKAQAILDKVEDDEGTNATGVNIIAIMNESWSDLEGFGNIELSESVLAKTKSIDDIYFGYAYSSVFGAGTSSSEFEFLTGDSMAFLPSGSIPYQQYILKDTPSLASILKEAGYATKAFHPGDKKSWNRDSAYPLLGFDSFTSREDMTVDIKEAHGGYVSDESDFKQLISDFESRDRSKPLFYFNVTIQSHGGYLDQNYQNTVTIKGHEGEFPMAEQYLTLVKETDEAFYELIEYFKGVDEPVIILMFGDHQPALEEEFYELVYNNGTEVSMAEYLGKFKVPYVIWANYDLEEEIAIGDTSLNYLGQYLLKCAGIKTSAYGNYLLDLAEMIEAISFPGYFANGKAYSHLETNGLTALIEEYRLVQYYALFGESDQKYFK